MHNTPWKLALGTVLSVGLIAAPLAAVPAAAEVAGEDVAAEVSAAAGTSPVVINEAYLSGGSPGAAYKSKFVELYNTSDAPVSLDGWSVQYRSATGTAAPTGVARLTGSVPAKGHYLVQGGSNGTQRRRPPGGRPGGHVPELQWLGRHHRAGQAGHRRHGSPRAQPLSRTV